MNLSEKLKQNIKNGSLFLLGVIVTIIITKISDKIVPNEPVMVKQYTDTLKIVHDYVVPPLLKDDSIIVEFEKKLKNLELLNKYDKELKERIVFSEANNEILPNLILSHSITDLKRKGFTQGNSSSYFISECPNFQSKFIDINIEFLNQEITKEIAYLRVNIYRVEKQDVRSFVLEDFYEVKPKNNIIRIYNDLTQGKYEVMFGFVFKNDLEKEFPTFYLKKCIITKT